MSIFVSGIDTVKLNIHFFLPLERCAVSIECFFAMILRDRKCSFQRDRVFSSKKIAKNNLYYIIYKP